MKKEDYKVSKWLTVAFLVTPEEFSLFLEELGSILIFRTGELLEAFQSIGREEWLEEYKTYRQGEKFRPALVTCEAGDVYAMEHQGKFLVYPRYPVIQVREHLFAITQDNRIQSMVFGKGSTRFGLIFSYPQIFYDPREKKIVEVFKDREAFNTVLFRKIQKWVRDYTRPASFILEGKKVNATFRVSDGCKNSA